MISKEKDACMSTNDACKLKSLRKVAEATLATIIQMLRDKMSTINAIAENRSVEKKLLLLLLLPLFLLVSFVVKAK